MNLRGVEEEEEEDEDEDEEKEDEDEERKEKKRRSDKKHEEKKMREAILMCYLNKMTQTTIRAKAERMSELQNLDEGHE